MKTSKSERHRAEILTCGSFFAGVGGIDLGFERTGAFKTVYANEFDKFPSKVFEENFDLKVDPRDIRDIKPEEIPNFDVLLAGFPCQAFSIAGNRQGFDDEFKLPSNLADCRLYKMAGNSVCVSVVYRIAEEIAKSIKG